MYRVRRTHKFMFNIFNDSWKRLAIIIDDEYTIDGMYQYFYYNKKITAGNIYKVREHSYDGEIKNYYAISTEKGKKGFYMSIFNEEGLKYYTLLATENNL